MPALCQSLRKGSRQERCVVNALVEERVSGGIEQEAKRLGSCGMNST